jgi:spore germination cell wall hydrolase CwlJ-like protein
MKTLRRTVLPAVIVTVVAVLSAGFTGHEEAGHEDTYMDVPAVALLPGARMRPAVAHPKIQAGGGFSEVSDGELYLLAKIIECESRYEPYQGKVAVGSVVLNRVMSGKFPNTIEGVIFQKGQFQPVTDGGWESKEPSELSYKAAYEALEGKRPAGENGQSVGNAQFFIYEDLAGSGASKWFRDRLKFVTTIGNHDFYSF